MEQFPVFWQQLARHPLQGYSFYLERMDLPGVDTWGYPVELIKRVSRMAMEGQSGRVDKVCVPNGTRAWCSMTLI